MGRIETPLPHPIPVTEWRTADPAHPDYPRLLTAFEDAVRRPGWSPKTVRLSDGWTAIDFCAERDGSFWKYKAAQIEDHPFLAALPPNAPRSVRHPYHAATRMKYLRMTDAGDFLRDDARAESAAHAYNAAT